ncbi:hypothetical protein SNE40_009516 [Patella caerulea]
MSWVEKATVLLVAIGCVNSMYFDCRRIGQECANGTPCDPDTGICVCDAAHQGHDCGLDITAIVTTGPEVCDPPCEMASICQKVGSQSKCYCADDAYYGAACENRRAVATCSGDAITITIVPYPAFSGLVYIKDNRTDTSCAFTGTTDPVTGILQYEASLAFNSDCSILKTPDQPAIGDAIYDAEVIIQNSPSFETSLDIVVKATCVHMNSGIATVSNDVGSVAVDQRANLTEDQTMTTYEPVLFAVQKANGMAIIPPLYIGTPLRLYFPMADTRKYTSLLLLSCDALNGPDAPQPVRVRLVDNGCPTADGISVMKGGIVYDNIVPSAIVYFSLFRFSNSPVISFECNVKVCEPSDVTCAPPQCNAQPGSVRRRRSAISGGSSAEIVLKETLTVLDPSDKIVVPVVPSNELPKKNVETVDQENQVQQEKCFQSEGIVVIIVILVVAVVLLFVVTMCLTVRFIKSKSQVKVIETPTPMTAERMIRIPRLNF